MVLLVYLNHQAKIEPNRSLSMSAWQCNTVWKRHGAQPCRANDEVSRELSICSAVTSYLLPTHLNRRKSIDSHIRNEPMAASPTWDNANAVKNPQGSTSMISMTQSAIIGGVFSQTHVHQFKSTSGLIISRSLFISVRPYGASTRASSTIRLP